MGGRKEGGWAGLDLRTADDAAIEQEPMMTGPKTVQWALHAAKHEQVGRKLFVVVFRGEE
jgi:hypothetical protein